MTGAVITLLLITFFINVWRGVSLPSLNLLYTTPILRPALAKTVKKVATGRPGRKHRVAALGQVSTKYDPVRAAFYINDDPAAFTSLKAHFHDLDLLIPEEVHALSPDGSLTVEDASDNGHSNLGPAEAARIVATNKMHVWMQTANVDLQVMGLVNNN